jgi:dTDP-4-dehydrorhamnose 3,5-epimerase
VTLSAENKRQFYVPPDFAHGFLVTGEDALFFYKCTDYYAPFAEGIVLWNDPEIGIEWPTDAPTLSGRDREAPPLREMPEGILPHYPSG